MSERIDPDAIAELKRSKKVVGELEPIIWDDRRDEPVSGAHRLKAGWTNVKHIRTKDDLEFWTLKMHYNVQRRIAPAELVSDFIAYAQVMEKAGKSNDEIVKALRAASPLSSDSQTNQYIPTRYLRSGGYQPRNSESKLGPLPEGSLPVRPRTDSDTGEPVRIGECWNCHVQGKITQSGLERLDVTFSGDTQTTTT